MKTGICTLPLVPLRLEPAERSEMISQMLFGELFEVLEENESWCNIRLLTDGYTGWCTRKMIQVLPESIYLSLLNAVSVLTTRPISPCIRQGDTSPQLFLPAGSRLHTFDPSSGSFLVYRTKSADVAEPEKEHWTLNTPSVPSVNKPIKTAFLFMNAPYLWGGKSILGMDCSGLVQVVFSICGQSLPRDARDQGLAGMVVDDLTGSIPGDLAFFSNSEGQIVHVGILIGNHQIIHASGCVHVDCIDSTGIYSGPLGCYTHYLHSIRRIFPSFND